jgi:hypothetical protein
MPKLAAGKPGQLKLCGEARGPRPHSRVAQINGGNALRQCAGCAMLRRVTLLSRARAAGEPGLSRERLLST